MIFGTLNRHIEKQRWTMRSRRASPAGRLLPVELAARKSPTQHEPSCRLAVVLSGRRRIDTDNVIRILEQRREVVRTGENTQSLLCSVKFKRLNGYIADR